MRKALPNRGTLRCSTMREEMKGQSLTTGVLVAAALFLTHSAFGQNDIVQREQAAHEVAVALVQGLGVALKNEMSKTGPAGAISVCKELAPEMAGKLSRVHGWRVTRVGTRVRNPLLGMPDAWEQQVLARFAERAGKGESLKGMDYSEVVNESGGRYFRFMQAIGVQALCLTCHGPKDQIPQSVHAVLTKHYPADQATGYKVGDLRGAVSIKQPLGPQR